MNKYLIEIEPKNVDDAIFIWQALQTFKKVGCYETKYNNE